MGGLRGLGLLAFVSIVLSGCAGGAAKVSETSAAPASVVIGEDATTGGHIVGLVINDEASGVEGASVGIQGIEQTVRTDQEGKFEFRNVPAGPHVLFAARIGYESMPKHVVVVEGETVEVKIQLAPVAVAQDYVEIIEFRLFMTCGGGLVVVTFTGGCPEQLGDHQVVADHNVTADLQTAVGELTWTQNSALSSREMNLVMGKEESGGSLPRFKYAYGSETGPSPVIVRADAEFDGLTDSEDGEHQIRHRVWVPFESADPPVAILVFQQPMTLWSSMSYGSPLPVDYTALPDA